MSTAATLLVAISVSIVVARNSSASDNTGLPSASDTTRRPSHAAAPLSDSAAPMPKEVAITTSTFRSRDLRATPPSVQRVTIISPAASKAALSMLSQPKATHSTIASAMPIAIPARSCRSGWESPIGLTRK